MEDNKTMELNNENEEVIDAYEPEDDVDTDTDLDEAEGEANIEVKDDDNMLGTLLGLLAIGGAATLLVVLAKRKELAAKRYERLKKKMEKAAAENGEEVTFTKCPEEDENEVIDGVDCEEVETEEDNEN